MRFILVATMPHEPFNTLVRKGTAGSTIMKIVEVSKPEAAYFTQHGGKRTAVLVVNLESASQIPSLAEPWFLSFQADCEFHPCMTPDDLQKAGLDALAKKWGRRIEP